MLERGPHGRWHAPRWHKDCWRGRPSGCCVACRARLAWFALMRRWR